jgi:hypothetical protein
MKRFSARRSVWRAPPKLEELFGVTEAGKGLIAMFMVWLALLALVLAFVYSTNPARIPFPTH